MQQITNNSVTNNSSTADQEVLVKVEGVSKKFCRSLKKSLWYGVCDIGAELNPFRRRVVGLSVNGERLLDETDSEPQITSNTPGHPPSGITNNSSALRPGEFWAVNDVSFELRRGECLGLIGHNGAGKTTLLKMLNGLIKPDAGKITMRGRVGALIALGAGFNPILTGRENIYINGSVLGLSKKEIDEKIDEIIDFAEIGEFIDSPVQNYSSGMNVRLGFAVATAMDPDVLIIDEVLAVGDTAFRIKCYNAIRRILSKTAVLFVSHSMFDIERVSSSVLVLAHGRPVFLGDKGGGIQVYNRQGLRSKQPSSGCVGFHLSQGVSAASLTRFDVTSESRAASLRLSMTVTCQHYIKATRLRLVFCDSSEANMPIAEWDSKVHGMSFDLKLGENFIDVDVDDIRLRSGAYEVRLALCDSEGQSYLAHTSENLACAVNTGVNAGPWYRI